MIVATISKDIYLRHQSNEYYFMFLKNRLQVHAFIKVQVTCIYKGTFPKSPEQIQRKRDSNERKRKNKLNTYHK